MRRARLSGARLEGASLSGADLSRADLRNADLRGANLRGAKLSGADLSGADLGRANLGRAFLNGTDFWQAALDGTRLEQADLRQALGLSQAKLDRACGDDTTRLPEELVVRYCD